jgi:hypothetical protein
MKKLNNYYTESVLFARIIPQEITQNSKVIENNNLAFA